MRRIVVENSTPKCKPTWKHSRRWSKSCQVARNLIPSLISHSYMHPLKEKVSTPKVNVKRVTLMILEPIVSLEQSSPSLTLPGFHLPLLAIPSTHPVWPLHRRHNQNRSGIFEPGSRPRLPSKILGSLERCRLQRIDDESRLPLLLVTCQHLDAWSSFEYIHEWNLVFEVALGVDDVRNRIHPILQSGLQCQMQLVTV